MFLYARFIPNLSYDPPLATKPFCISTTIRPKLILDPARCTSNTSLNIHNEINKHDLVFITMKCRYSRASTNYPVRSESRNLSAAHSTLLTAEIFHPRHRYEPRIRP